ncbi:DUF4134 domain-containing protein [Hanamia caeni]|jgi:hypothetical protein|uniref:DUF4134 domain-containing protein n=1 Tax=Hanamia caeni TaxID=2294116 RepID=A0A3M9NRP2_9BACT|nr:DUF4134 domain-containing protein [Hanamia caeni]RNI39863.1 DUF4134 domain-containing protein [Hanamia caeni]
MECVNGIFQEKNKKRIYKLIATSVLLIQQLAVFAQDGNAGINAANTQVRSYFTSGTNLMYAVGAVVGLIGAVKVYNKWNSGDPDTGKVAAAWFGSCVFLVIVATVIKSFFGV